jgi:hypothetical protein
MGIYKDKLSILEKVERGEISIEDAESKLKGDSKATESATVQEKPQEKIKEQVKEKKDENYMPRDINIPTRRERKITLAESFQNWQPHMMAGMTRTSDSKREWPWKDENWQWMWQNFGYPVYVNHSIEINQDTKLCIVQYQGDLFLRGWDEPMLKLNGAVFDVRIGQEENIIRIASSTGQMQLWVPKGVTQVEAKIEPGDIWISTVFADLDINCQSGDLGCERIKGNIKSWVNGGDIRLMGIDGTINANATRGNVEVRNIISNDVMLKSSEGNIWLTLDSVSSGRFRCENDKGDINLLTNGELACELLVEASMGGRISPVILPWQRLLERSESKLRGILNGGGASINLITQGGRIYIQESWAKGFPMPASS